MHGSGFDTTLRDARRGSPEAFSSLFREHQPALLRTIRGYAPELAEDVCSEAWLYVAKELAQFRGDERGFRAWLVTVARNRLADAIRYRARRPATSMTALELGGESRAGQTPDAATVALEADATERTLALIRTLPRSQAEAVLLRVVAGLDTKSVAIIMDRPEGTVRVLCHRGLRALATRFAIADAVA